MDKEILNHFHAILNIMQQHGLSHAQQYMRLYEMINNWWIDSSIHVTNAIGFLMSGWPL